MSGYTSTSEQCPEAWTCLTSICECQKDPQKVNWVDYCIVSQPVGGCLTDLSIFTDVDSETAQTFRGVDPHMH